MATAYEVGRVSMELAKRPHTSCSYSRTVATVFSFMNYFKEPAVKNLEYFMEGYNIGMKSGEIDGAAICLSAYGVVGIHLGKNLNIVLAEMEGFHQAFHDDMESNFTMILLLPWHQFVLNLIGRSDNPFKLSGAIVQEESYLIEVRRTGNKIGQVTITISRMALLYILLDVDGASKEVANLDMKVVAKGTHISVPFLLTFAALAMLALARATQKRKAWRKAKMITRIIEKFARAGNLNAPPLLELVTAERASLRRRSHTADVKRAYESAVKMLSQSGFSVFEAIGNERAGEYMQSSGDTFWAETFLSRAHRLYDEWGATTKTKHMEEKYSFLGKSKSQSSHGHKSVGVSMRQRFNYKESNEKTMMIEPSPLS